MLLIYNKCSFFAATKAKEVIDYSTANPTTLGLFPNYAALHDAKNDNKVEHLFGIQYNDAAGAGNPLQSSYLPLHQPLVSKIDGIATSIPTNEFFASYDAGDIRAKNREGFFFTDYYTDGFKLPLINRGKAYVFKHLDIVANGTLGVEGTSRSDLNIPQIRYAETLLIYAEAQNRADGIANAAAYAAVNAIRSRAGLTPLAGLTQTAFEEAVWTERWHELCYEGIIGLICFVYAKHRMKQLKGLIIWLGTLTKVLTSHCKLNIYYSQYLHQKLKTTRS